MLARPLLISALAAVLATAGACDSDHVSDHTAEIIGGEASFDDDAVVSLSIGCTGTLITPNVVLTAAHCIPSFQVYFGVDEANRIATRNVIDQFVAREYDTGGLFGGGDVALLRLASDAPPEIAPIPYNTTPLTEADEGKLARIVGFGQSEDTGFGLRRQGTIAIAEVGDLLIKADEPVVTVCFGDSGGPMFLDIDGVETVIGVASFVEGNCNGTSRHARVDIYEDVFIREVVAAWSGPCPYDGNCDPQAQCGEFADPDCDGCGLDGICASGCDDKDLDCPLGAFEGQVCNNREDCESLLCVQAPDDPRVSFCSTPCDQCAPPLTVCATGAGPDGEDVCHFFGPSVSVQGAVCAENADCRSNVCDPEARICVELCGDDGTADCGDDYECRELAGGVDACRLPDGGGCSTTGGGVPAWLLAMLAIALAAARRKRA